MRPSPRPVTPFLLPLLLSATLLAACVGSQRARRAESKVALGQAYLQERNPEDAIVVLRDAIRLNSRSWEAWDHLAVALMEKAQYEDSEKAFRKAIRIAPERAEPHLNYGLLLFGQARVEEAIVEYELALKDLTYRKPAIIQNSLGFALLQQGRAEEAVNLLREAVHRAPNICQIRYNLGLALLETARRDEALTSFQETLTLCPDEALGAWFQAGAIYLDLGDYERAASHLREVTRRRPGSEQARQAQALIDGEGL
jgi:Tfp pilus assembly protein PilF